MTYRSELSRNLVTFSEVSLLKISMNAQAKVFSQINLNVPKLSQCIKKIDKKDKNNYRPVSILSDIPKLYEKCMYQQINEYFESFLSKFQCSFRQGFSAQHFLLGMVKKIKKLRSNKGVFAAVLTDLSKAFDCTSHGLLIAMLSAFGFRYYFIFAYLYKRKQKTKVD